MSERSDKARSFWKKAFTLFVTIHGICGFMMFISEEAMQTDMFAAMAYTGAKDWDGLALHSIRMENTATVSKTIINIGCVGAVVFCPAYQAYLDSNDHYIEAVQSRVKAEQKKIRGA